MGKISPFLIQVRAWSEGHVRELMFFLIIFLTASVSFAAGYLANREFNHAPIVIEVHQNAQP